MYKLLELVTELSGINDSDNTASKTFDGLCKQLNCNHSNTLVPPCMKKIRHVYYFIILWQLTTLQEE